jgi:hypothetical protein
MTSQEKHSLEDRKQEKHSLREDRKQSVCSVMHTNKWLFD